jgi:hypothetical protein
MFLRTPKSIRWKKGRHSNTAGTETSCSDLLRMSYPIYCILQLDDFLAVLHTQSPYTTCSAAWRTSETRNIYSRNFMFMWPCIVTHFFIIKPTDALIFPNLLLSRNSTCFGQFLCPSSGVFHCKFVTGICHANLMTAFKHDHWSCLKT